MKRGEAYWVNLEDSAPPELGKTRPGLVISNSEQNEFLETVVIIPLSSRPPEIWPLRLKLDLRLKKECFAVVAGIRQVHKARIMDKIGAASPTDLKKLEDALLAYLGD